MLPLGGLQYELNSVNVTARSRLTGIVSRSADQKGGLSVAAETRLHNSAVFSEITAETILGRITSRSGQEVLTAPSNVEAAFK